jgi:uncharacterized membrane protein YraQ (UPF0718 family)
MSLDDVYNMMWGNLNLVEKGMVLFTVVLYVFFSVYSPSTREQTATSIVVGTTSLLRLSLLLLSGVFLGSLVGTFLPRDLIARFLGQESGLTGVLLGAVFGAVMPGGPYVLFPIVAALYASGATIPPMIAMIFAWQNIALTRIPSDLAFLSGVGGQRLIWLRVLLGLPVPIVMGLLAGTVASTVFKA